jgi:NTE family protein
MTGQLGLVLSGGGARTAFQVGVLTAISEWVSEDKSPFTVITGTSAGSINAAYLAANADRFRTAVATLKRMWGHLRTSDIYYSDIISGHYSKTLINVFHLIRRGLKDSNSFLNAIPLAKLLSSHIDFDRIEYCLQQGFLSSLAITATSFNKSVSTTFVQSSTRKEWERVRRVGISEVIRVKHLMASTAIPFLFPPVKINQQFFGDGSLRNFSPLSPAIRSGADRLVVIGIRPINEVDNPIKETISFGDIFSRILNTILFDSLDVDQERLSRINHTVSTSNTGELKHIKSIIVRPSVDFTELVTSFDYECPRILTHLLRLIGSKNNGYDLKSYLMFEPGYLNALIDHGYRDAQNQKAAILDVLTG